jgi:hypothetical protein
VRRGVRFKHHECETTFLEGVFSRGDRRLSSVLERAFRLGARFDGWAEHFHLDAWRQAFRDEGIDPERYAYGDWPPTAAFRGTSSTPRQQEVAAPRAEARARRGDALDLRADELHGCAPFARECVKGTVKETTGRPLDLSLPILSTPAAPGPGLPARACDAPPLAPAPSVPATGAAPSGPRYRYRLQFAKTDG